MHVAQVRQVAVVDCATPVNQSVNAGCFWLDHVRVWSVTADVGIVLKVALLMIMIVMVTEKDDGY